MSLTHLVVPHNMPQAFHENDPLHSALESAYIVRAHLSDGAVALPVAAITHSSDVWQPPGWLHAGHQTRAVARAFIAPGFVSSSRLPSSWPQRDALAAALRVVSCVLLWHRCVIVALMLAVWVASSAVNKLLCSAKLLRPAEVHIAVCKPQARDPTCAMCSSLALGVSMAHNALL